MFASCLINVILLLLFSCSVVSDALQLHGLQHARLPCLSLSPRACSNSCPPSRWCHPTSSSSVTPFSSCPQSLPASESFPMSWLFASGGQSIGALSSTLQWIFRVDFLYDWLVWSPCCLKDSPESSPAPRFKNTTVLQCSVFFMVQLSHLYMTTGKTIALTV